MVGINVKKTKTSSPDRTRTYTKQFTDIQTNVSHDEVYYITSNFFLFLLVLCDIVEKQILTKIIKGSFLI